MKILLANDAFPPIIDGAITALMTLAAGFEARGHDVAFLVPADPKIPPTNGCAIFNTYSFPYPNYPPYRFAIPWARPVRRQIRDHDFDLVHIHSPFGTGIIAQQLAAERNIPCVYTFHTLFTFVLEQYAKPFGNLLQRPLIKFLRRFCHSVDRVVTQTEPVKNLLLEYGVTQQIDVLPLGIDPVTVVPTTKIDLRKRYGIPEGTPLLLFVGRLAVEKNLPWLVLGLKVAKEKGVPFHCVIVGDGGERVGLERLVVQHDLTKQVTITGLISQEDLAQHYANSDLFCICSLVESQCLAAVEAMMNGVPILGVRAMGLQVTIQEGVNGLLSEPNPRSFQEHLWRLLEHPSALQRLRAGATAVAETFRADQCCDRYLALYEALTHATHRATIAPLKVFPLVAQSFIRC